MKSVLPGIIVQSQEPIPYMLSQTSTHDLSTPDLKMNASLMPSDARRIHITHVPTYSKPSFV